MAAATLAADLVPFRWPESWTDPRHVALFEGGPVNCLVLSGPAGPIAEAARKAGMSVIYMNSLGAAPLGELNWDTPAPVVAINRLVWPRMHALGGADQAQAGPTGAPWIDSNSWVARLAAARAPSKQTWLDFAPPKDEAAPTETAYRVAIADAEATGARWILTLDAKLSRSLAAGVASALKTWRSILATLSFFARRKAWRAYAHQGPLGVISAFSGDHEFMGTQFLNLAARRNLLYSVIDRSRLAAAPLAGLRAAIWLDQEAPAPGDAGRLAEFARGGGLLIASRAASPAFKGERRLDCAVAGYDLHTLGKGTLATTAKAWDDPYFLAADAHSLVSRRYDPIRMFNGSGCWVHHSVAPAARDRLIQLVSFGSMSRAGGTGTSDVSLRIAAEHRSVVLHVLDGEPSPLQPALVGANLEYRLPQFATYAALEVRA